MQRAAARALSLVSKFVLREELNIIHIYGFLSNFQFTLKANFFYKINYF